MSLLSLSKRILGKDEKKPAKKAPKISAAKKQTKKTAEKETPKKATVDKGAITTGVIGLAEIISEKGIRQQSQGVAVFRVLSTVSKGHIAEAVESRFGVKVKSVRTLNANPKTRRRGITAGKTNRWKKAYVTVDNIQSLASPK
jgi:large subunit ribosomal protein L23